MKDQLNQLFHFPISAGLFPPHSMLHMHIHSYFAFSLHERAVVGLGFFFPKWKNSPYWLGLIATSSAQVGHSWVWTSWRTPNAAPPLAESTCWSVIAWLWDSYQLFTVCELSPSLSDKWYNCINTYFSTKQFNTRQVQVQMRPKGLWVNFKGQEFFRVHVV